MNYLGLRTEKLKPTIEQLNVLLSCYHVYYQNLRNFHWNVTGRHFFTLHEQFEGMYNDAKVKIDEVAERILTLGSRPLSKMSDYLEKSQVSEAGVVYEERDMLAKLLEDHAQIIDCMRDVVEAADEISDEGTIDLIGAYIRELEKTSWMLNAYLSKEKATLS